MTTARGRSRPSTRGGLCAGGSAVQPRRPPAHHARRHAQDRVSSLAKPEIRLGVGLPSIRGRDGTDELDCDGRSGLTGAALSVSASNSSRSRFMGRNQPCRAGPGVVEMKLSLGSRPLSVHGLPLRFARGCNSAGRTARNTPQGFECILGRKCVLGASTHCKLLQTANIMACKPARAQRHELCLAVNSMFPR